MTKSHKRKRPMTLIEIMIVMFLITLLAGTVTYKVKDAMDYGKAFKTHQSIKQLKEILSIAVQRQPHKKERIESEWDKVVKRSPLAGNPKSLLKDGWGEPFKVRIYKENGHFVIEVHSDSFVRYNETHDTFFEDEDDDEDLQH